MFLASMVMKKKLRILYYKSAMLVQFGLAFVYRMLHLMDVYFIETNVCLDMDKLD